MQADTTLTTSELATDLKVATLNVLELLAPWSGATAVPAPDPLTAETVARVEIAPHLSDPATLHVLRDHHNKPFYVVTSANAPDRTHSHPQDAADDIHARTGTKHIG
ncbi:hypothetical protein [Antribacter gilvus]|uniref:hypothetical protein n=1 Tax=Antribacter gilvus TaxID=2304675 RepID=UPI000F779010|nr:hypothetical protein [Antribacter gilvus]